MKFSEKDVNLRLIKTAVMFNDNYFKTSDPDEYATITYTEILKELQIPQSSQLWKYPFDYSMKYYPKKMTKEGIISVEDDGENVETTVQSRNVYREGSESFIGLSEDMFEDILFNISQAGRKILSYIVKSGLNLEITLSIDDVAEDLGVSKGSVYSGVKDLCTYSILRKIRAGKYAINLYRIKDDKLAQYVEDFIAGKTKYKRKQVHTAIVTICNRKLSSKTVKNEERETAGKANYTSDAAYHIPAYRQQ